jgi:hypothetical protein
MLRLLFLHKSNQVNTVDANFNTFEIVQNMLFRPQLPVKSASLLKCHSYGIGLLFENAARNIKSSTFQTLEHLSELADGFSNHDILSTGNLQHTDMVCAYTAQAFKVFNSHIDRTGNQTLEKCNSMFFQNTSTVKYNINNDFTELFETSKC